MLRTLKAIKKWIYSKKNSEKNTWRVKKVN